MIQRKHTGSAALSRRSFLGGTGAATATIATSPAWLAPGARAAGGGQRDLLLYVFLRGGMDALTMFPPYADGDLYVQRPSLAIPPPGQASGAIDLDGFFGLAPAAAALYPAFADGNLAVVQAAGSTDPSRSHFDAMKFIETATPGMPGVLVDSGWLGRHMLSIPPVGAGDLRGLAISSTLPLTLAGAPNVMPTYDPKGVDFYGHGHTADLRRSAIEAMYANVPAPTGPAALSSLASIDLLQGLDLANYTPANGAAYPESEFGDRLAQVAAILKGDIGIETIELDYGGWDDHDDLGPQTGNMAARMADFADSLHAFYTDVAGELDRVTVVVQSEFGRRVDENGSAGTDHGRAGAMLVLGGNVNGGQVYGNWPGLGPSELDDFAVAVTTDYRDVLAEVLVDRHDSVNPADIFLGYTPVPLGITS